MAAEDLYSTKAQPFGSFWAFNNNLTSSSSPEKLNKIHQYIFYSYEGQTPPTNGSLQLNLFPNTYILNFITVGSGKKITNESWNIKLSN